MMTAKMLNQIQLAIISLVYCFQIITLYNAFALAIAYSITEHPD